MTLQSLNKETGNELSLNSVLKMILQTLRIPEYSALSADIKLFQRYFLSPLLINLM